MSLAIPAPPREPKDRQVPRRALAVAVSIAVVLGGGVGTVALSGTGTAAASPRPLVPAAMTPAPGPVAASPSAPDAGVPTPPTSPVAAAPPAPKPAQPPPAAPSTTVAGVPPVPPDIDPGPQPAPAGMTAAPPSPLAGTPVPGGGKRMSAGTTGGANVADFTHWGTYQWGGQEPAGKVRAFWLMDRTGNTGVHEMIQAWVNYVDWLRAYWDPQLPYVAYYRDDAHAGQCGNFGVVGYSFATICTDHSLLINSGDQTLGETWFVSRNEGQYLHFNGPYVELADGLARGFSVQGMTNVVDHELGHLLGLGHSSSTASVMYPSLYPMGTTLLPYDTNDFWGLVALYNGHVQAIEP